MTTRAFVVTYELATIAVSVLFAYLIAFRFSKERRLLHWAIYWGWVIGGYIWEPFFDFTAHVEWSDHWHMLYALDGKAEPVLLGFVYVLWFAAPTILVVEYRERIERALGRRTLAWMMLYFLLAAFYLDFATTSFRPVWTYYHAWPNVLEYTLLGPFVNAFIGAGAYLLFLKLDDLRKRGLQYSLAGLLWRATVAASLPSAFLVVLIVVFQPLPFFNDALLPYVKSQ